MEENLPVTSKTVFREDVVRHAGRRDRIGIVLANGNDSESNSEYEDEEERVGEGLVLVSWYPKGDEEEVEEGLLLVVDRSWSQGEIVRWKDPSKGIIKGIVSDVHMKVNIRTAGGMQPLAKNVDVSELTPLQKFYSELTIALGAWIGTVREVFLKLIVKFRNGARCIVEGEQVNMLIDSTDQRDEDCPFYCALFYPGQSVVGTSRVFRDVQWINGPRPVFSSSQRITCIVDEVIVSGLRVHWLERGYTTCSSDTSLVPPDTLITEEKLSQVTLFDHFNKTNVQIGDKAFYTLKEADIQQSQDQADKGEQVDLGQCTKAQPENKKSKHSSKDQGRDDEEEKNEENDSTATDESADDEDSDHGNARESRPAGTSSRRNEGRHQAVATVPRSHGNRKRRQFRRKKKKHHVPVRLVAGEKVCVEVESTSKLLTITWQDGSKEYDIPATDLLPVLHVDEFEFFPGGFIKDKTRPAHDACFGVVQTADSSQRTCKVKWMNGDSNVYDDCVSVYDIGDHPDYNFRFGDVVFRLADEQSEGNEDGGPHREKPTCGQVLFVDIEGHINVLWTDRTTSALPPQNLFAVHIEDWSSSGSHHSSSDEEWETTSEVSTDHEPFLEGSNLLNDMQILDDIGQRSVEALGSAGHNEHANEDQQNEPESVPAEANEEAQITEEDTKQSEAESKSQLDAAATNDVKPKVASIVSDNAHKVTEKFSFLEDPPASHKFVSAPFQPENFRLFNMAIAREASEMGKSLPDGVHVRVFESRFDLGSIMIEGPAGTPYEDGLFIFDLQLPPDYPKSPPHVSYLSQFSSERLNPNLYEDGTVCVSLLGTWNGKGSENWTKKSNLTQLILSLQGLILCEEPYFNEAGYEKHKCSAEGAENSRMYNEMVIIKVLQSLNRLIKAPPVVFQNEIMLHMKRSLPRLFKRIYSWLKNFAPSDFLTKYPLSSTVETDDTASKPEFPLLPLSFGFCITLLRNLKILESTAEKSIM